MKAIIGRKKEMTQVFKEDGTVIPCTVVDVSDVKVCGLKSLKKDGYAAVILGQGKKKKFIKPEKTLYKGIKDVPQVVSEFRYDGEVEFKVGDTVSPDLFQVGDKVKVTGITKGKGFQGVIKRWGFHGGSRTHGQSDRERAPGSIGAGTTPGRVFKGKKMPGRMGNMKKSILNLEIVDVDAENSLICIKGAIPGGSNSVLKIVKK